MTMFYRRTWSQRDNDSVIGGGSSNPGGPSGGHVLLGKADCEDAVVDQDSLIAK